MSDEEKMSDVTENVRSPIVQQTRRLSDPINRQSVALAKVSGGRAAAAKKRATATTAVTGSAVKPRVTRRELKKLTEMDLEDKADVPDNTPDLRKQTPASHPF